MLVSVQNVTKSFLDDIVLRDVSLDVQENDRIGLLGVNGAGKTTLLNIIAGRLETDEGTVVRKRGLEVGYLQQNDALDGERTLDEEARDAFAHIYAVQHRIDACAAKLVTRPDNLSLLAEYDRLAVQLDMLDAYRLDDKINRVLGGLGFGGFNRGTKISTLSGGEKMRFAIAKMLLRSPELLILDEPTNHLDFSMLGWLEEYLRGYKGALLTVSHDRYFLDNVARDICEIERHQLTRYKGGYTGFVAQKAENRRAAQRSWEKQQEEIAQMEEYVRRNMARASTSNMAKSRQNALDKMVRLERPRPEPKTISLKFGYDMEPYSLVLECESLGVSVGKGENARTLYSNINLEVHRGEKVAIVGLNGVGKTTFLKAAQNLVPRQGLVRWGTNVRVGYFDQELAGLDMELPVLEAVHRRFPTKTEFEIRSALGRLLIEGEAVYKKVRELSGANRAKVAFAILQMQRTNVLLLDEPTNHLDYRAKEVLEGALRGFGGTLLVVSHDRYFLRRVPTRILEMHPGGFVNYNGNYDDYLEQKAGEPQAGAQPDQDSTINGDCGPTDPGKNTAKNAKARRAEEAQRRNRLSALEKEIARLEMAIESAHMSLADPANVSDYQLLAELSENLQQDIALLDSVMEEWLELTES